MGGNKVIRKKIKSNGKFFFFLIVKKNLLWKSVFAYLTLFQKMPGAITPKDLIKPNSIEPNVIERSRLSLFLKKIIVPLDWVGSSF